MKVETTILEDHQAQLTVEVDADLMNGMKQRAARQLARRVKIPGFRPGKAPYPVIVRQLGEAAIVEEALELLVDDIYPKVIEQAGIKPYGPGSLENVVQMEPPVLEFKVPLQAQVTLGDYHSVRKAYEPKDVTEKDVEEMLDNLRERQAVIEPVERPAQEGDLVTIRINGRRMQVEEGQDEILIRDRQVPIVLKTNDAAEKDEEESSEDSMPEWPFPGFSQHLIGISASDEKTLHYSYPEDAQQQAFRGANAEFHLVVENVKERKPPELDDDFAASIGDFETLQDLRESIHTSLEDQNRQTYNETYDDDILEEGLALASFKYPPQMLESELDDLIKDLDNRLKGQGLDIDLYLKTRDIDMESLREELKPAAEKRLKRSLYLIEIAKAENIQIESEELQTEAKNTFDYLSRALPQEEVRKLSDRRVYTSLVNNIMMDMINRRAMERYRDLCSGKITEQEVESTILSDDTEVSSNEPADQLNGATDIEVISPEVEAITSEPVEEEEASSI